MKAYKKIFSLLLVLTLTLGLGTTALAADYTDPQPGDTGIQPGDTLAMPALTDWATLTASWGVRVTFVDWDDTVLSSEVVPVTDAALGSSIAPEDPSRSGYSFTGWERNDAAGGTATFGDDGSVTGIKGPGPIVFIARYAELLPPPPAQGSLTVTKKLAGNAAEADRAFVFTVTLDNAEINGVCGGMTFTDGVSTFRLKGGESRTAEGLPEGTAFTVTEEDCSADGYVTEKSGDTGVIAAGKELIAIFTNTKNITLVPEPEPEPKTGSLTVTKKLAGDAAEADRAFAFTVTLDNAEINGVCGDMTFTDGVGTFRLKGGESKTAEGLPEGTAFTVTEEDCSADGYVTEKSGDTGVITDGETLEAVFTNTKDAAPTPPDEPDPEPVPPKTGDDSHLGLWIAILAVCAAGVVCVVILAGKKKKKD